MDYQFVSQVAGIPCIIRVEHYFKQAAWKGATWACDSEMDYYGYEEIAYAVLDRKGYPAAWLKRKLTPKEHARITKEIADAMREEREATMGDF